MAGKTMRVKAALEHFDSPTCPRCGHSATPTETSGYVCHSCGPREPEMSDEETNKRVDAIEGKTDK
jgi:tRNA(Ile2) C34 agmatinyltransferase TiaS